MGDGCRISVHDARSGKLVTIELTQMYPYAPCNCIEFNDRKISLVHRNSVTSRNPTILREQSELDDIKARSQLTQYLESHVVPTQVYIATDGSYRYPYNKSAYLFADENGYTILFDSGCPMTNQHIRSSYDAEVFAVLLAMRRLTWLQYHSSFRGQVTFIIDNKAVIQQF